MDDGTLSDDDTLSRVRRFNRTVTRRIGALGEDYLGTGRPLGEARLLFEIGKDGATVRDLRERLALDSGYLSRMLRALEAQKLITTGRDPDDGRVRRVTLAARGKRAWAMLDRRSKDMAASLLEPLSPAQRERLLAAMTEIERLFRASAVTIEVVDPFGQESEDCLRAYYTELQERFDEGFDPQSYLAARPDDLVPPSGWLLVARLDGVPIGCGALKIGGSGYGEIKRMWVAKSARGIGVAQRLLDALEKQARQAGVQVVQLDTNRKLVEARGLYARNGYREIPAYNTNPYADHWFEKRLTGSDT
ncbi:MAG: helix-turn-helix domain-containing GNAT family N-acetyltransferase [Rhodocyclaceae bacterium]